MPDLRQRAYELEIMDDLNCSGEILDQTLHELEFINKWLGGNAVTLNAVSNLFSDLPKDHIYTIADLGCGGGDMTLHIFDWGKRNGYKFHITGIDANENAIGYAKKRVKGNPSITFESLNIFSEHFRMLKFDVVIGTLFYHHFTHKELIAFFGQLKHQVKIGFIINDIHRHALAFHSIKILTGLFSRSPMVKNDAPLSVRRAFLREDLKEILRAAGFHNFSIRWRWAFRWEVIVRTVQ
jgi:2-polyprenyl-3-methyl-5-hydroxy-6-metoxy-1,4-benzoquinol methylase